MPRRRHLLTLALLACSLFLRALVPAGWMPAANAGPLAIEPCPAALPQPTMAMAGHHGAGSSDHDSSHKDHAGGDACFSALLIGFAPTDQPAVLAAPASIREERAAPPVKSNLSTGPPSPPPPATGPPTLA